MAPPPSEQILRSRIADLAPWFHNMKLGGVETAPDHFLGDYPAWKWERFQQAVPEDLTGRTVLDIGCNAGFFSLEMKRRGADRVVGIDSDARYLAQARLASEVRDANIELRQMSVYDVAQLRGRFDLVLFTGVLYHLRHPLLALDLIYEHVAQDMLICQSMQRGSSNIHGLRENYPFSETELFERADVPRMTFIEHRYADDPTNWWVPNRACMEAMLRSAGFRILDQPESEVYLCRRDRRPDAVEAPPAILT